MIPWLLATALATMPTGTTVGTPTGAVTGSPTDSGLASTGAAVRLLSPEAEIDFGEALFLESPVLDCAAFRVVGSDAVERPSVCEPIGASADGPVLVIRPESAWDGAELHLETVDGERLATLDLVGDPVLSDVEAVAVDRTVSYSGVSQRVCREGPVATVVRADTEPTEPGVLLREEDLVVYHGASDGSWPEAGPLVEGTFWLATWDRAGTRSPWVMDSVTLASDGMVRTDLRLGFDPGNPDSCPSSESPWTLGEEVLADGAEEPGTLPDPDDEQKGCGCATGGPGAAWLGLPLLLVFRRRYQSSSTSA